MCVEIEFNQSDQIEESWLLRLGGFCSFPGANQKAATIPLRQSRKPQKRERERLFASSKLVSSSSPLGSISSQLPA